jgi:hypothetical protein
LTTSIRIADSGTHYDDIFFGQAGAQILYRKFTTI